MAGKKTTHVRMLRTKGVFHFICQNLAASQRFIKSKSTALKCLFYICLFWVGGGEELSVFFYIVLENCIHVCHIPWSTLIISVSHSPLPVPCPLNWTAHWISLVLPIDTWCGVVHWGIDSLLVATLTKEKLSFWGLYTWGRISHSLRWHQTF